MSTEKRQPIGLFSNLTNHFQDAIREAITKERHETDRKLRAFETRLLIRISEMGDDVLREISEMKNDILSAISKNSKNTEAQQQSSQEAIQVDGKIWGFVKGYIRLQ